MSERRPDETQDAYLVRLIREDERKRLIEHFRRLVGESRAAGDTARAFAFGEAVIELQMMNGGSGERSEDH